MENTALTHGLNCDMNATHLWRPWVGKTRSRTAAQKPYERAAGGEQHMKVQVFTHPVKLFWPKSRCFDYLYRDAEILLRNYPVQATIHLYEEEEEEEEEEDEKELN